MKSRLFSLGKRLAEVVVAWGIKEMKNVRLKSVTESILCHPPVHSTMCITSRILVVPRNDGAGARKSLST